MNFVSKNISFLLKKEGITMDNFGKLFGLNRGSISSYVKGKSIPKLETLIKISDRYAILIDDLIHQDLSIAGIKSKENKGSLNDFSEEQIITYLYLKDKEFSKNPLLWMYIKMKLLDKKIHKEEDLIRIIEAKNLIL